MKTHLMDSMAAFFAPASPDSFSPPPTHYPPQPDTFDELVGQDGSVRPHWQEFLKGFSALNATERRLAQETAERMLKADGVTYLAGQNGQQTDRPWQLDLFPLLISQEEWQQLEAGLIQRARLLNHILCDFYSVFNFW